MLVGHSQGHKEGNSDENSEEERLIGCAEQVESDDLLGKDTCGLRTLWGVKVKVIPSKGNHLSRETKAQNLLHPRGGSPSSHHFPTSTRNDPNQWWTPVQATS